MMGWIWASQVCAYQLDMIVKRDDDRLTRLPIGKGKCFQHIINLIP